MNIPITIRLCVLADRGPFTKEIRPEMFGSPDLCSFPV